MDFSTELIGQVVGLLMSEGKAWRKANPKAGAYEIENGLREALRKVGAAFLGELYEAEDRGHVPSEVTCDCGEQAKYLFRRKAKTLSSFGWVDYRRAYYVCPTCHQGNYPLDRRLGLQAG